jgi:iduronate 2-sulfatase
MRHLLAVAWSMGLAAWAAGGALAAGPNVLFIAVDDLRVELGCYGQAYVQSPNIDRLAGWGMLFERAYCQQAVCNPSRASLLSGLRPDTIEVWDLPTHFRQNLPDVVTLPQLFKPHGYHTENIGKVFHNWRQDAYKGDPVSWSVPAVMHYANHGEDKAKVEGRLPPNLATCPKTEIRDVPDEAYFDGRIAAGAVEALGRLKDRPFFLAVGFWKPHAQFNAPKRYWDLYDRAKIAPPAHPEPPTGVPAIAMHDAREMLRAFADRPGGRPTAAEVLALRHGYYAATSFVDAQIGRVLDELERLELRKNTIVVLWSDHGYHLGEHALWAKTSNFELDARVPLVIATPNHKGGNRTRALVELLDLYPTLADLCGLPAPANLAGKSLRPVLDDPSATVKTGAVTQHPRPAYYTDDEEPMTAMGYSLRTDRYRYTEWRDVAGSSVLARELYDHELDPDETVNLAGESKHGELIEQLSAQLSATAPPKTVGK